MAQEFDIEIALPTSYQAVGLYLGRYTYCLRLCGICIDL